MACVLEQRITGWYILIFGCLQKDFISLSAQISLSDVGTIAIKVVTRSHYNHSRYHEEDGCEEEHLTKRPVV